MSWLLTIISLWMSVWVVKVHVHRVEGMTHKTKITRKTEGIGAETKSLCDGSSGILKLCSKHQRSTMVSVVKAQQSPFVSQKIILQLITLFMLTMPSLQWSPRDCTSWPLSRLRVLPRTRLQAGWLVMCLDMGNTPCWSLEWTMDAPICRMTKSWNLLCFYMWHNTLAGIPNHWSQHRKVFQDGEWVTGVYFKEVKIADFKYIYFSVIDVHDHHYSQGSLELKWHWITGGIIIHASWGCFKFEAM